jgi:hypothetical protein
MAAGDAAVWSRAGCRRKQAEVCACEMGAQRQQAHGLLELMQPSGLVPDVITYNAAVSSYEKRAQRQQALHLLGGDAAVWPRARHHRIQRCCECP